MKSQGFNVHAFVVLRLKIAIDTSHINGLILVILKTKKVSFSDQTIMVVMTIYDYLWVLVLGWRVVFKQLCAFLLNQLRVTP